MKQAMVVAAWTFFALDAAAVLYFLAWSLVAGTREGEQAYAIAFLLVTALLLAAGGGGLGVATRRKSALGIGCAGVALAIPFLVVLGLWIGNLLGM